jgi:hypothetical protein
VDVRNRRPREAWKQGGAKKDQKVDGITMTNEAEKQ